jgi:CheY-like chemotaxis protein
MDRGLELGTSLTSNGAAPLQNARPPVNRAARVLVVDDDILGADLRVVLLRSLGYDAEVSNSGTEAIGRTDINEFDIVLLDHDMPILNGIQTAQKLRETGTYSIIVMFSGRTDIRPTRAGSLTHLCQKEAVFRRLSSH